MNKNKGFTLIELLVVIAIIGILSTIILFVVSDVKERSNNNVIKSELNQARTQADLFYANGNTYTNVCSSASENVNPKGIYGMVLKAAKKTGLTSITVNGTGTLTTATCNALSSYWAAEVPLRGNSGTMWCVDSSKKGGITTTSIGNTVSCP